MKTDWLDLLGRNTLSFTVTSWLVSTVYSLSALPALLEKSREGRAQRAGLLALVMRVLTTRMHLINLQTFWAFPQPLRKLVPQRATHWMPYSLFPAHMFPDVGQQTHFLKWAGKGLCCWHSLPWYLYFKKQRALKFIISIKIHLDLLWKWNINIAESPTQEDSNLAFSLKLWWTCYVVLSIAWLFCASTLTFRRQLAVDGWAWTMYGF